MFVSFRFHSVAHGDTFFSCVACPSLSMLIDDFEGDYFFLKCVFVCSVVAFGIAEAHSKSDFNVALSIKRNVMKSFTFIPKE